MKSKRWKNLAIIIYLLTVTNAYSQELYITDTIIDNGNKILVFSDNSYQYLELMDTAKTFRNIHSVYEDDVLDTAKLFSNYWSTNIVHVKFKNLYFLEDTITVKLADEKKITPPCQGLKTSNFGPRWQKMHKGIDFGLQQNDSVKSPFAGIVRYAKFNTGGYGNLIVIRHYNGLETYYAHLSQINVKPNDLIAAGQFIGKIGSTGHSTGPHLHFECRLMGNAIDPELIFDFNNQTLHSLELQVHSKMFTYQKNGIKEEINHNEIEIIESSDSQKAKEIKKHNSKKRKKNPSRYQGNM